MKGWNCGLIFSWCPGVVWGLRQTTRNLIQGNTGVLWYKCLVLGNDVGLSRTIERRMVGWQWIRNYVAGSGRGPLRLGFYPRGVRVRFVVDKSGTGTVFFLDTSGFHVVFLQKCRTEMAFIYHRHFISQKFRSSLNDSVATKIICNSATSITSVN